VVALDGDRIEFFVFDYKIRILPDLLAAPLVRAVDGLARHVTDELLPEAIAGLLVYLSKRDTL